ncbi:MAG: hypothetical protein ABSD96_15650, partial [Candidatus Korobacteraceae bacterium]
MNKVPSPSRLNSASHFGLAQCDTLGGIIEASLRNIVIALFTVAAAEGACTANRQGLTPTFPETVVFPHRSGSDMDLPRWARFECSTMPSQLRF